MMRVVAIAALASMLLAIAGPRTTHAIAGLRSEFTSLDIMTAPAAAGEVRPQPQHWVPVADYTRALARSPASIAERRSMQE